ncbi:MAG TPA: hypothetical protein VEA37_08110 [Flavobacterium sp.]|nr:hypothetical protein [Flavobacterium sp.]
MATKKRRSTTKRKRTTKAVKQSGTSNKVQDILKKAKAPGKRKSKSGRTYSERRKNRSDVPGTRL